MGYHVMCQTPGFECKGEWIRSTMINSTFPFFHIQFYVIAKDLLSLNNGTRHLYRLGYNRWP